MKPNHLKQLISAKAAWSEPLSDAEKQLGFRGWYGSGHLPHRDLPGTTQFVTYRLADAMPAARRQEWESLLTLPSTPERQEQMESYLDRGRGECLLRNPELAAIVQENLWHHDGVHYQLLGWVVMPNHVHVIADLWTTPLPSIVQRWKSYTAKVINRRIQRCGQVWQEDYFDQYIRDSDHLQRVVQYVESDPVRVGLTVSPDRWQWSSAKFRGSPGPVIPELTHPTANRHPSDNQG